MIRKMTGNIEIITLNTEYRFVRPFLVIEGIFNSEKQRIDGHLQLPIRDIVISTEDNIRKYIEYRMKEEVIKRRGEFKWDGNNYNQVGNFPIHHVHYERCDDLYLEDVRLIVLDK